MSTVDIPGKFSCGQLEKWGFKTNGNQWACTVLWHVNYLKILHVNTNVATDVIKSLELEFGKKVPSTQTCGKMYEYLGMTID